MASEELRRKKEELRQKQIEEGRECTLKRMKECMDEDGVLDITAFRNMYKTEYNSLSRCFGSVDNAVKAAGAIKVTSQKKTASLCQKLAYNMIKESTKTKNIAELAREYGVTRAALNQLYKHLEKMVMRAQAE